MGKRECSLEKLVIMDLKKLFEETYKGKKVFLTGHTGFKGTWLLSWLNGLGANVKGYALSPEYENDLYHFVNGDSLCNSVIADIRNYDKLEQEILDFEPDFIFHLAAQPLVRKSYNNPVYTFEVNVNGTINVLQALRKIKNHCSVVIVTTDKVYENSENGKPFIEEDKLGGYDPYSASKAMAEIAVSSYRDSFFSKDSYNTHKKAIASVRAGNVIGGGDMSSDRIIPDIIRGIRKNQVIELRKPFSVRPWQFVLEPLSGYLILGAKLNSDPVRFSSGWNFGPNPGETLSVKEMTEIFIEKFGQGKFEVNVRGNDPHEAGFLMLNIDKAVEKLGWSPKYNVYECIDLTVKGYQQFEKGNKDFINEQISGYYRF